MQAGRKNKRKDCAQVWNTSPHGLLLFAKRSHRNLTWSHNSPSKHKLRSRNQGSKTSVCLWPDFVRAGAEVTVYLFCYWLGTWKWLTCVLSYVFFFPKNFLCETSIETILVPKMGHRITMKSYVVVLAKLLSKSSSFQTLLSFSILSQETKDGCCVN